MDLLYFMILLLLMKEIRANCGQLKRCKCSHARTRVFCQNKALHHIPAETPITVKQLVLTGNQIKHIDMDLIRSFHHLSLLDISDQQHQSCLPPPSGWPSTIVLKGACKTSSLLRSFWVTRQTTFQAHFTASSWYASDFSAPGEQTTAYEDPITTTPVLPSTSTRRYRHPLATPRTTATTTRTTPPAIRASPPRSLLDTRRTKTKASSMLTASSKLSTTTALVVRTRRKIPAPVRQPPNNTTRALTTTETLYTTHSLASSAMTAIIITPAVPATDLLAIVLPLAIVIILLMCFMLFMIWLFTEQFVDKCLYCCEYIHCLICARILRLQAKKKNSPRPTPKTSPKDSYAYSLGRRRCRRNIEHKDFTFDSSEVSPISDNEEIELYNRLSMNHSPKVPQLSVETIKAHII